LHSCASDYKAYFDVHVEELKIPMVVRIVTD
jgi:hypothetical protein